MQEGGPAVGPGPHVFGEEGARRGEVVAFDREAGLGTVRDRAGREYLFHCTEMADGSRDAVPGEGVVFEVGPGRLGLWEARRLVRSG